MVRIVYSSDVHGNEQVWLKWLNAAKEYKADYLIMNGDLTGKKIVPIVKLSNGTWKSAKFLDREWNLKSEREVEELSQRIRYAGMYPFVTTMEEINKIKNDPKKVEKLFDEIMVKEFERWLDLVKEKVPSNVQVIISPGNDDIFEIDDVIKSCDRVIYPNDKVVYIGDKYPLITCEYVNPSPWNTPREEPEDKLKKRLESKFKMVPEEERLNTLAMFHAPPYDSGLDMAPKLDKNLKPILVGGHPVMVPVGSKAVREVIEKYQPLMGLHSHIHESPGEVKIGRTLCINPGSEYDRGIFRAYIIDLSEQGIEKYWRTYG